LSRSVASFFPSWAKPLFIIFVANLISVQSPFHPPVVSSHAYFHCWTRGPCSSGLCVSLVIARDRLPPGFLPLKYGESLRDFAGPPVRRRNCPHCPFFFFFEKCRSSRPPYVTPPLKLVKFVRCLLLITFSKAGIFGLVYNESPTESYARTHCGDNVATARPLYVEIYFLNLIHPPPPLAEAPANSSEEVGRVLPLLSSPGWVLLGAR